MEYLADNIFLDTWNNSNGPLATGARSSFVWEMDSYNIVDVLYALQIVCAVILENNKKNIEDNLKTVLGRLVYYKTICPEVS